MSQITIEDFKKIDLRVAKILDVQEIPGVDRLWKLEIDLGSEKKSIVAGVKKFYTAEQLRGKSIVVINNLVPSVIRGVESNGMLLAAKDESGLTLITVDKDIPAGSAIG